MTIGRKYRAFSVLIVAMILVALMVISIWPMLSPRTNPKLVARQASVRNASLGIGLSLTINTTHIQSGSGMAVTVEVFNALSQPNNVSYMQNWRVNGLSVGPCGVLNSLMGIAIYQGYYTENNASLGTPLQLYAPDEYFCPMLLAYVSGYAFQPLSDNATIYASCTPNPCFTVAMNATMSFNGYWTIPLEGAFRTFDPGTYTVVGGDEWGDLAVLHFVVGNSS